MILLVCGEETFLSTKKISQIKEKFLSDNKEMGIISTYNEIDFNVNDFSKKALAVTFFEEKRLFILENLLSKKITESKNKIDEKHIGDEKKLLEILDNAPETSLIVFFEKSQKPKNNLTKKIQDKSQKIWEFEKMQSQKLMRWAKNEILKRGSTIEKNALEKLISYSNDDIWQLDQEIEKLTLYKKDQEITIDDIEKLVPFTLQTNIFTFIDNIGKKNKKAAIYELKNLLDRGEEPVYILRMIIYQIKTMLVIKDLLETGLNKKGITLKTKKHPFVIEKTINQVNNFSLKELLSIYNKIFNLEMSLKRDGQKPENALIFFAEKLC